MNNNHQSHEIIVSGIHLDLTPALKTYVREKVERLFRHEERIVRLRVELECDSKQQVSKRFTVKAHIQIHGPTSTPMNRPRIATKPSIFSWTNSTACFAAAPPSLRRSANIRTASSGPTSNCRKQFDRRAAGLSRRTKKARRMAGFFVGFISD